MSPSNGPDDRSSHHRDLEDSFFGKPRAELRERLRKAERTRTRQMETLAEVSGIDPRLMIDVDEDGIGINCGGKHPRFNATTLDGVSQAERFGLNENGYATAVGMPFPFDGIEQVSVELAPFGVT